MRKITRAAAALALAVGATTMVTATNAQAADGAWHGCPSGAVCIYPQNAGWNGDRPSDVYYSYGAHNLSNQVGQHYMANNQTDGAAARTCTGYDGAGCEGYLYPGTFIDKDFTPINSIVLERP